MGRPVGLKGFLGLYVETENLPYFQVGSSVTIDDQTLVVRALRRGKKGHEVSFHEIADRNEAERIRNLDVFVSERRPLETGEYWPDQLVGLSVRPGGGTVVAVEHGPSQDRLIVQRGPDRFAVPFVDELVPTVDIESGYVEIAEIEGLTEPSD